MAIATGRRVHTLNELRDALLDIGPDSIFYHFWGGLLHPRFEEREYNNDFASWVRHNLHDDTLAEQLAVIDPTRYPDIDELRQELLDLVEERLDQSDVERPRELASVLPHLSVSSIFYHFVDARRRMGGHTDDFRIWLAAFGDPYDTLCERLGNVDPYFASLGELRDQLAAVLTEFFREGGAA